MRRDPAPMRSILATNGAAPVVSATIRRVACVCCACWIETCGDYEEAKRRLLDTPLCLPALFTLAGTKPGKGCVIERTPSDAAMRTMPAAVANHWTTMTERGRTRGAHSRERAAQMIAIHKLDLHPTHHVPRGLTAP